MSVAIDKSENDIMSEAWQHHDEIKEHPYWINCDESLLDDLTIRFYRLTDFIWNHEFMKAIKHKINPYALPLYNAHDFRYLLGSKRYKDCEKSDVVRALQLYLQQYHLALEFDSDAYVNELKAGAIPLKVFAIAVRYDKEQHSYAVTFPYYAACMSDDGKEVVEKYWIDSEEQLLENIANLDDYVEKYCSGPVYKGTREAWAKEREELLNGAAETKNHYCAYRVKK